MASRIKSFVGYYYVYIPTVQLSQSNCFGCKVFSLDRFRLATPEALVTLPPFCIPKFLKYYLQITDCCSIRNKFCSELMGGAYYDGLIYHPYYS